MREHVTNFTPVPLIWKKSLPSNLVEGVKNSSPASFSGGTVGACPNRGAHCYLEINGISGYQPEKGDRYFQGGDAEAKKDCVNRSGLYIKGRDFGEVLTDSLCTADLQSEGMTNVRQFGDVIDKELWDGVYASRMNDVVVHLKGGAVVKDWSDRYGCRRQGCEEVWLEWGSRNLYGIPANLDHGCRGYVVMRQVAFIFPDPPICLYRTSDLP